MPRITIVLPVYNHERYLEQTLRSLFAQNYTDFQIVAINDGSDDGSLEILNRHRRRVLVIDSPHEGPAAARNRGLRATDSEFVAFMDSDDLCRPERLRLQVEQLETVDLVASALSFIDARGQTLPGTWACPGEAANHYWASLVERNWIGTPSVMIQRDVLDAAGMFDERFSHAEDYDLWLRIGRMHSIGYIDSPLIQCRRHASNISIDIDSHQRFERLALQKVDRHAAWEALRRRYDNPQQSAEAWLWFLLRRGDVMFREEAVRVAHEFPDSRPVQFALGVFQHDAGAYEEARAAFDALKDNDAAVVHNLGVIYARCGNRQAAEAHFQSALRLRPGYYDAEFNLAAIRNGQDVRLTRRPFREQTIPMVGSY